MTTQKFDIYRLAKSTYVASRKNYISVPTRPITLSRIVHSLYPQIVAPIFIVGSPRSGTTFLGKCLNNLSTISYHFEPIATKTVSRFVHDESWQGWQAKIFYKVVYRWLMRIHLDGDRVFAEKTPRNAHIIPFLVDCFPDARFIHIIRDGRDVALSHSKKPWLRADARSSGKHEPGGYAYGPAPRFWVEPERHHEFEHTSDIHRCIWNWRRSVESAREGGKHVDPTAYKEIRYEELVSHPIEIGNEIVEFLNLPPEPNFFDSLCAAKQSSVGKWRLEFTTDQLQDIENEAGYLLDELGYT